MAKIDLHENEFFEKFVGPDHVDSNDVQFWYQLLSCSFNFTRVHDPKHVDKTLNPFIDLLALNNSRSLNFGSLIRVSLDRVSRIKPKGNQSTNPYYVFQSFNAFYLIRTICKNFIENSSEDMLIQAFRAKVDIDVQQAPQQQTTPSAPPTPMQQLNTTESMPLSNGQTSVASAVVNEESKKEEVTSGSVVFDQFVSTLIEIIVDFPSNDSTYLLRVEAINCLLVLLSVQMYSDNQANQFYIFKTLMHKKCSIHALILTKTLLNNFIRQDPLPQESGSIILGLASGLWKVLTLGYGGQEEEEQDDMPYLARQSLLLLNILTNHYTTGSNPYREAIINCQDSKFNPSDPQAAIDIVNNDVLTTASTSQSILISNNIKIEFCQLFETICKHLNNDQVALLLYLLLHSNKIFKPYILTTAAHQLDQLVLPLLRILYSNIQKGSHHIYMVLIIFVILSEEISFSNALQNITVRGLHWFKDRIINDISLNSFTILIVIRSFQYNTFRVKDKFLLTNLFATLANLSNHAKCLHPYVCQRLVDLLERLAKRYLTIAKTNSKVKNLSAAQAPAELFRPNDPLAKALATDTYKHEYTQDASAIELNSSLPQGDDNIQTTGFHQNGGVCDESNSISINILDSQHQSTNNGLDDNIVAVKNESNSSGQLSPGDSSQSEHVNIAIDDTKIDLAWVEEIIRMLLEVLNNLLDSQLSTNTDLIYTLLYKRDVFSSLLASHPSFYDMIINIKRILAFYYNKVEGFQRQLDVGEIKELIESTSKEWILNQNPKDINSQLLFRYVEDEKPEDFFIPYMWTKIYYSSGIAWNPKRIVLFNPELV